MPPVGGAVDGTVMVDPAGATAYRVRAVNTAGGHGPWSLPSGSVSIAAVLAPPDQPATFLPSLITDSDVQLTWAAPEDVEAITGYTIQAADHAGGPWTTVARVNGDATRWMHNGLPASGATKHYRVRAHNRFNHSEWATTSVGLKTGEPPTGLRALRYTTNQGNHAIEVWLGSYACAPDATDCWAVIEYRESGGAWQFGSQGQSDYGIVVNSVRKVIQVSARMVIHSGATIPADVVSAESFVDQACVLCRVR